MNPLREFKHYVIGGALAATDDVFEKTRIDQFGGASNKKFMIKRFR
jgi:hypothetical protein